MELVHGKALAGQGEDKDTQTQVKTHVVTECTVYFLTTAIVSEIESKVVL